MLVPRAARQVTLLELLQLPGGIPYRLVLSLSHWHQLPRVLYAGPVCKVIHCHGIIVIGTGIVRLPPHSVRLTAETV